MGNRRFGLGRILFVGLVVLAGLGPAGPAQAEQWVQNFAPTELWSGPDSGAVSFGTAPQWDYFEVFSSAANGRVYVLSARTSNFAFIDGSTVGPSGPPPVGWPANLASSPTTATSAQGSASSPSGAAAPLAAPTTVALTLPAQSGPGTDPSIQALIGPVSGFALDADVGLWPALQALGGIHHSWTLQALASTATRLDWGDLQADAAALYEPKRAIVTINRRWSRSDPRALAAIIEHEAKHVADILAGVDVTTIAGCMQTETNAFREEAKTWGELVGPAGKPDPRDDLDRSLNYKLSILQRTPEMIEPLISQNAGYRTECQLRSSDLPG